MAKSSGFNIKVKMNATNKILKDHGLNEGGRVERYLRDTADRLMNPFVPFDNGMLRRLKTYPSNNEIKYTSPYAHYQYNGKKAQGASKPKGISRKISGERLRYHTPGTGAEWDKLMLEKKSKELVKDVENYINRGG